jgi:hypothetical protein
LAITIETVEFVNWKALLAVFVVVAIVGMLYATDRGRNYLDMLTNRVGSFVKNFPLLNLLYQPGNEFQISLTADKESFYGQTYSLDNVSLKVSGICQGAIKVGGIELQKEEKQCSLDLEDLRGQFEYSAGGVVRASGTVSSATFDGYSSTSAAGDLQISVEVIPVGEMTLAGFSQAAIELSSATGTVEQIGSEGAVESWKELKGERLSISSFVGYMSLKDSSISLEGIAGSVRGETFSW